MEDKIPPRTSELNSEGGGGRQESMLSLEVPGGSRRGR